MIAAIYCPQSTRRMVFAVALLAVLLIPRLAWVVTEVCHGENPRWSGPITGRYALTIVAHSSDTPDLALAGVFKVEWDSTRPEKRRAEMLNFRSAFLDWFVREWTKQGGDRDTAVRAVREYPFERYDFSSPLQCDLPN